MHRVTRAVTHCDCAGGGNRQPAPRRHWDLPRLMINLAYPSRKHLSAKVRTFIDFIAEHFAKMDYERKWTARFGVD